jgi:hypothetical protein
MSGGSRFFYASGASGSYTVPAGAFVTGIWCHSSGDGATLTITPARPDVRTPVAGPAIPIPSGAVLSVGRPTLAGNSDELGTGSVLTFVGSDAYLVTLFGEGGP